MMRACSVPTSCGRRAEALFGCAVLRHLARQSDSPLRREQKIDLPSDPGTMDQINVDQLRSLINQRTVMYNNGKYCYLHEPMAVPRTRGKKIA